MDLSFFCRMLRSWQLFSARGTDDWLGAAGTATSLSSEDTTAIKNRITLSVSSPALLSTRDAAAEKEHMHNHGGDPGWYQALARRAPRGAVHVVLPGVHVLVLPWRCGDVHRHRTCQRDSVNRREGEEGLKKKIELMVSRNVCLQS